MNVFSGALLVISALVVTSCGGYKAKKASDLTAEHGQLVGVLLDRDGKAHPDFSVVLIKSDETTKIASNTMDSDGSFVLWPTSAGSYNVIGVQSDLEKVIVQNVVINEAQDGVNIGEIKIGYTGALGGLVKLSDGTDADDVSINVIGTEEWTTTVSKDQVKGVYALLTIPAGKYSVKFSKTGYVTHTEENVEITEKGTTNLDVTLTKE